MRKTARPVVWEGNGVQPPVPDPITERRLAALPPSCPPDDAREVHDLLWKAVLMPSGGLPPIGGRGVAGTLGLRCRVPARRVILCILPPSTDRHRVDVALQTIGLVWLRVALALPDTGRVAGV